MTQAQAPRLSLLDVATIVMTTVIATLAFWIAVAGPGEPIPVHFNVQGEADRWAPRGEVAGIFAFQALILLVTSGGMSLGIRRIADKTTRRGLALGQFISLLVVGCVTAFMAVAMLGRALPPMSSVTALFSIVLLIVGAGLGRVPPNLVVGVRTPWSFKSRRAWDRSNRLAGRLLFWLGLLGLVSVPFVPAPIGLQGLFVLTLIASAWVVFESWRVWRNDPERQPF